MTLGHPVCARLAGLKVSSPNPHLATLLPLCHPEKFTFLLLSSKKILPLMKVLHFIVLFKFSVSLLIRLVVVAITESGM